MSYNRLLKNALSEFKADPRNKVFATEPLLLASVFEETGKEISPATLRGTIAAYLSGTIDSQVTEIYDAAVYVCGQLARACFGEDPEDEDEEVDYDISWIEDADGSYIAEIRSS